MTDYTSLATVTMSFTKAEIAEACEAETTPDPLDEWEKLAKTCRYAAMPTVLEKIELCEAIPALIAMVREKDESSFAWEDLYRRAQARVTAAEAKLKELEGELDTIVRGRYDGIEVTHYSANECRNIARAALRR